MTTSFELIDLATGNLVGSYASEDAARSRAAHIRSTASSRRGGLGLLRVRDDDQGPIAEGIDLVGPAQPVATINPISV